MLTEIYCVARMEDQLIDKRGLGTDPGSAYIAGKCVPLFQWSLRSSASPPFKIHLNTLILSKAGSPDSRVDLNVVKLATGRQ